MVWFTRSINKLTNQQSNDVKSKIYFLREIKIPHFNLPTSIPRKYRRMSRSLISNFAAKYIFSLLISSLSLCVTTISSTYKIKTVIFPLSACLKKRVWSDCLWWYSYFCIAWVNLPNQTLGDCLSPYKEFLNLYTFPPFIRLTRLDLHEEVKLLKRPI